MTSAREDIATEQKIVVFFDVCSSTKILEDLLSTGNIRAYRNMLIHLKKFLQESTADADMEIYKFLGDGWVLFFPIHISGRRLTKMLTELSCFFQRYLEGKISPLLQNRPDVLGLTFGVDLGPVVRIVMLNRPEYIGRPLNVAARLQGAIKDRDKKPAYKVLFTKHSFRHLDLDSNDAKLVTRSLRNIFGGERYECMKLTLRIPAACRGSTRSRHK